MWDSILTGLSDFLPFILAVGGALMSSENFPKKYHSKAMVVLLMLGVIGSGVTIASHHRADVAHKTEIDNMRDDNRKVNERVDAVSKQINEVLIALTRKQPENELTRRSNILAALRNEYVLQHDNVSSAIIAGTQEPPAEWVNKRLLELGEKWTLHSPPKASPMPVTQFSPAEGRQPDAELQLVERAVEAVESCHSFQNDSDKRRKEAANLLQRDSFAATSKSKQLLDEEMQTYQQLYKQEFMEVRRLLALKVPFAVRPSTAFEDPGNMGGVTGVCSDLKELTDAYLNREYSLGKITLDQGRQYLGKTQPR